MVNNHVLSFTPALSVQCSTTAYSDRSKRVLLFTLGGGDSSESVVATLRVLQEQLQRKWSKNKDDVTHDMNVYFDANNN
jgi:hypothetical protein